MTAGTGTDAEAEADAEAGTDADAGIDAAVATIPTVESNAPISGATGTVISEGAVPTFWPAE